MILPHPKDTIHKVWLLRILSSIADDSYLVQHLRLKGGTYAALRGIVQRFSVDLDFDLLNVKEIPTVRKHLVIIFRKLGLKVDDQSRRVPQYFLKYHNIPNERNTLRLDITCPPPRNNEYEPIRILEIDRILYGQTIPTLFANKLVALIDRWEKHGTFASRDVYDIHSLFFQGLRYKPEIIEERTKLTVQKFFQKLKTFITKNFNQTIIDQDLNTLLPLNEFQKIRKILKSEVLFFLSAEIEHHREFAAL